MCPIVVAESNLFSTVIAVRHLGDKEIPAATAAVGLREAVALVGRQQ